MGPGTDGPGGMGVPGGDGGAPGDMQGGPGKGGPGSSADDSDISGNAPTGTPPDGGPGGTADGAATEEVGTPDAGTTQSATGSGDSSDYESFSDVVEAYATDIAEIEAGDAYGNNIVELYDPMRYIGADGTDDPVWARVVMGAAEGDMSMLASMNMGLAWTAAGTDADIEWQWDGGHVPSEVLGDSFALCVDEMYGSHVEGAVAVEKPAAEAQVVNGDADEATGADISSWVSYADGHAIFSLAAVRADQRAIFSGRGACQ